MFPDPAPISARLNTPADALDALLPLRHAVITEGYARFEGWRSQITRRSFLISGLNFAQYLALRRRDLRPLQAVLSPWGLSSLGRIEAHVQPNLDAVLTSLADIAGVERPNLPKRPRPHQFLRGDRQLEANTTELFGECDAGRRVRVMVTLPSEAAQQYSLVRELMEHGMDIARINCAHDDANAWEAMVAYVRRAERETGRTCKVAMDLGGPKSRTADLRKPKAGVLHKGDTVLMTADKPPKKHGATAALRCTLTDALAQLKIGESVYFDDGRIGAVVEHLRPEGVVVRITRAREGGEKLKPDKGVNFPDTDLRLDPLTPKDLQDLDFVAAHADMVNYSFVQSAEDITRLQDELAKRSGGRVVSLVAKIETARAVRALPEIIVRAAGVQPFGVMIARGDLAVEIGWERLAEIQEEILWLCEAAHVPVIWATQVLEGLAKDGLPSRAEITDAAMSERAECVMMNKGPYILDALDILDGVLRRMQTHQVKKSSRLRALKSWAGS
ncbi:MAG: pyruvate kinase [Anaerolineae bacterium]|jgi:pyruvate kinase|nr:pyruvate kinase [Anaerolineae bacterium]